MARKMTAKYPGSCRECSEEISPGDRIVHAGKKENYHAACYEDRNEVAANDSGARTAADAEYAAGERDAENYRFNRDTFGEDYAVAEEFAWGLKTGEGY